MTYAENLVDLIGKTPLIKLNALSQESGNLVLGKCEFLNPGGSVKDRIGLNLIKDALIHKRINKETTIIEPTSGNTGIGLASICATYGLKLILTMPESMSIERRKILSALGAKLVLTEAKLGMKGAINKSIELKKEIENSYIPSQFDNMANPQMHEQTTAQEILNDCDKKVDFFVASVGTGGTVSGVGKV